MCLDSEEERRSAHWRAEVAELKLRHGAAQCVELDADKKASIAREEIMRISLQGCKSAHD